MLAVFQKLSLPTTDKTYLMCCPSTKVVKNDSKSFPSYRKVTRRQIVRHFVVVVVVFALTDRASTIPSNIRGCQSGTWSQRGTKVNGSHHGDNPLLRPTGIQIATKSYATLQVQQWHRPIIAKRFIKLSLLHIESSLDLRRMTPNNIKKTSLFHIESNPDRLELLSLELVARVVYLAVTLRTTPASAEVLSSILVRKPEFVLFLP